MHQRAYSLGCFRGDAGSAGFDPIEPTGWTTLRPNRGIRITVEPR
jgi:hypothetical protein